MKTNAVEKFNFNNLPDLAQATPEPVEMSGEYWTPEEVGESRRLFFFGLNVRERRRYGAARRELPVVQFVEGDGKGGVRSVRNGSRRLVGIFESFAQSIKQGDAFEIIYLGKKKNKNNYSSATGVPPTDSYGTFPYLTINGMMNCTVQWRGAPD